MTSYTNPFRRGCADFFRLDAVTSLTGIPTIAAVTDLTDPMYTIASSYREDDWITRRVRPVIQPTTLNPVWLGLIAEPGFEIDPAPDYQPVREGNTETIFNYTLRSAQPVVTAELAYNGLADIESIFALPGGSNASPPLIYEGNQSNTPNLLEPAKGLLIIQYNEDDPLYARLKLYFRGTFEAAKYRHEITHQSFEMIYRALPGKDGSGVPFQNDRCFSAKWSVLLTAPNVPIAYR